MHISKAQTENPTGVNQRGFNLGGLGRNRTTDTRIFNPSHNVKFTSSKLKKRNEFFEF
jgi:hypothetical protein